MVSIKKVQGHNAMAGFTQERKITGGGESPHPATNGNFHFQTAGTLSFYA
jgi:hypothetical protein